MQLLYLSSLLAVVALSGCAAPFPPYKEPDPAKEVTARLRVSVVAGVKATVLQHQNNSSDCLIEKGAVEIPVHTNVSGLAGESKRKIGMPVVDAYWEKIGSEVYLPATDDLTLSVTFSGAGSLYRAACLVAFRFTPLPARNYQLVLQAGQKQGGGGACFIDFQEIVENKESMKYSQEQVPVRAVAVRGSRGWDALCATQSTPAEN